MTKAVITASDIKVLRAIKACGFLGVDSKGELFLESRRIVSRFRLIRLISHKLVKANNDSLPLGNITERRPQSYSLTKRGLEVADA